jgi:hypothetical protein
MISKIIKVDGYLLIVDSSEISEGDLCLANAKTYNNEIVTYRSAPCPSPYVSNLNILRKIIAHLPLNGSSILGGVDLLPPLELRYTEEDIIRAFNIGVNSQFESTELKLNKDETFDRHSKNILKLIKSLKQPKYPVEFEFETKDVVKDVLVGTYKW